MDAASSGEPLKPSTAIIELFTGSGVDLRDRERFLVLIRRYLAEEPLLVEEWQRYCYDKRTSPSPYLDGREVGFYDAGRRDVVTYDDPVDTCAAFLYREASWVLERDRLTY